MNRKRKAFIRQRLVSRLETAFQNIYHNATLGYWKAPEDCKDFFSSELQWEILQDHFSWIVDEINDTSGHDHDYIEQYIARDYGKVYTYGRGGRTCAPKSWIHTGGGSTFNVSMPETDDLSRTAILRLALDVEAWNEYVKAECSSENIAEILGQAYADAKEANEEELKEKLTHLVTI